MSPKDAPKGVDVRLEWCTLEDFDIIEELQREFKPARVRQLAREWDNRKVGVLQAAEYLDHTGETKLHLTDGHHRARAHEAALAAAKSEGKDWVAPSLPVVVFGEMTRQDIAIDFISTNNDGRKIPPFDNYQVAIIAKEPWALAMKQAFNRSAPFSLTRKAGDRDIAATNSVRRAMERANKLFDKPGKWVEAKKLIGLVQELILKAWPVADKGFKRQNGDVIQALMGLLVINREQLVDSDDAAMNRSVLAGVMAQHDAGMWINMSKLMPENQNAASSGARYRFLILLWARAYNEVAGADGYDVIQESA